LRWNEVPGASYGIQVKRINEPWPHPFIFIAVPAGTTSYSITGLAATGNYEFRVMSICAGSENSSLYSAPKQFKTCSTADVCHHCLTPENLSTTNVTVSTAKLLWDTAQGAATYEVQYRKASDANWSAPIATNNDRLNLSDLTSGTDYLFQVRSVCASDVSSDYSAQSSFRTESCNLPINFRPKNADYRSVNMRWQEAAGTLRYELQYKSIASSTWTGPITTTGDNKVIDGLMPNTEYEAQIKAVCSSSSGDDSGYSESVIFTTSCRTPENITVSTSSNSATITWSETDAGVYELRYRKVTSSLPWTEITNITTNTRTLNGLVGGDYELQVRSKCSSNDLSEWSVKTSFSLSCLDPTNLSAEPGRDQVTLSWSGGGEAFNIRYRSNGPNWTVIQVQRSPYTIRNLQEDTTYDFQVQSICALNSNGEDVLHSNWIPSGAGLTVTTSGGSCSNPMVLHCTNRYINIKRKGSGKLRVSWGSSNQLSGWRLRIQPVNGEPTIKYDNWDVDKPVDCDPGEPPDHRDYFKTVNGLIPGTAYEFAVAKKCSNGEFSTFHKRTYTTPPASSVTPNALPPTAVGSKGATLNWQSVPGAVGYKVIYSFADSDDETSTVINVSASSLRPPYR